MASPILPNRPVTVPISRAEFDRFVKAQAGIGSLLWIIHRGSFGDPGSLVAELEFLLKPYHSELAEVAAQLQRRFDKSGKVPGPGYFPRRKLRVIHGQRGSG